MIYEKITIYISKIGKKRNDFFFKLNKIEDLYRFFTNSLQI